VESSSNHPLPDPAAPHQCEWGDCATPPLWVDFAVGRLVIPAWLCPAHAAELDEASQELDPLDLAGTIALIAQGTHQPVESVESAVFGRGWLP
jgi:hypothetical protein